MSKKALNFYLNDSSLKKNTLQTITKKPGMI